jgi:outer membrane protein assembly factor BamB
MKSEVTGSQPWRRAVWIVELLIVQVFLAVAPCLSKEAGNEVRFMTADRDEVYVSTRGGTILALSATERRLLWAFKNALFDVATSPTLDARHVYVWMANQASNQAALVALNRATGEQVWSRTLGPPYGKNAPTVCSDVVVATDVVNQVTLGLGTDTGAVQWDTHDLPFLLLPPPTVEGKQLWYPAARRDDLGDRRVTVIDCSSGSLVRTSFPGAAVGPWLNPSRTVFLVKGGVVLGSEREHQRTEISFYDATTSRKLWSYEFPILEGLGLQPAISHRRWIGGDSHITFIDLKDGRVTFNQKLKDGLFQSRVYEDRLVFRSGSHHVIAFAIDRPRLVWQKSFKSLLTSPTVLCAAGLCVASSGRRIVIMDPENGRITGSIDLGER